MPSRFRHLWLVVLLLALLLVRGAAAYPWPVRPFGVAHPVRGNFGDPRTVFRHGVLDPEGLEGDGAFSFHNGVDISAPAGTPVYSIFSGRTVVVTTSLVVVASPNHHAFQYVHLDPLVVTGQQVKAQRTVLGFVKASAGHVHLTELDHGRLANPLARGHLAPYYDYTRPKVADVLFRSPDGETLNPDGIHGSVDIAAASSDLPSVPVPGSWNGLPVAPALLEWSLTSFSGAKVVPLTVVADFRRTLPFNRDFWSIYARGTYQNKPRFGNKQYVDMPGRYEYRLTRSPLETRRLPDGLYSVHVKAVDIRGNVGSRIQDFTVCNVDPVSCGSTTPPPPG